MRHKIKFDWRATLACTLAFFTPAITQAQEDDDAPKMTIGSKAPDIDVKHWLSDNDGKFEKVTKLEEGKVYIIEFWATWCPPCIASMPHLAEVQAEYADKGVQIISISDEDLETVEEFLAKPARGDSEERTYGELTASYCLTTDPDTSVMDDYFRAAGQRGIPCCFIVGKTGLVEWIGHPMRMDKVLKQVVEDKWDREKYAAEFKAEKEAEMRRAKMQSKITKAMRSVQRLIQADKKDEAIDKLTDIMEDEDFADAKSMLEPMRLQLMVEAGHKDAATAAAEFTKNNAKDSMALNQVAWGIYELHEAKEEVSDEVLAAAKKMAEAAVKAEPDSGAILDTLAHLIYVVDGDLEKAIEIQTKAVESATSEDEAAQLKPFLEQLKEEKKSGKKAKKKKSESDF